MLSDPQSKIIRAFDLLNGNFPPGHAWHGVPFPGLFIVDERGIVRAKFFEEDHRERYTTSNILVRQFHADNGLPRTTVQAKHLKLSYSASDSVVSAGNRISLLLNVELEPGMHVYAPGVADEYIPVDWKLPESAGLLAHPVAYPPPVKLRFAVIEETLPVYQGSFRLLRDLTIGQAQEIGPLAGPDGKLSVDGSFRYQACDDKQCFPPQTVPLKWEFRLSRHDAQRAPAELQRKAGDNRD
jgi:DsbC/DsbD-like thiol-disulfide interchange protein